MGLNTARLVIDTDVLIRWMDGGRHSLHFHCLPPIPSARICLLLILLCKHFCTDLGVRSFLVKQSRLGVNTAAQLLTSLGNFVKQQLLSEESEQTLVIYICIEYYAKP